MGSMQFIIDAAKHCIRLHRTLQGSPHEAPKKKKLEPLLKGATQPMLPERFSAFIQTATSCAWHFFCCALLVCHEGRRQSSSVQRNRGKGKKTDFPTFQTPRTCEHSRSLAPYPSVVMEVRDHRRRVHWCRYATQSTLRQVVEPRLTIKSGETIRPCGNIWCYASQLFIQLMATWVGDLWIHFGCGSFR